jgi:probable H4MPT-linked C1 transfer pathway protein
MTSVIGWDIGGAHLKAARAEDGRIVAATQILCTPHHGLAHLERAIREAADQLGAAKRHAVTMTAELSDAFATRAQGVVSIAAIFTREIGAGDIAFYAGARGFVSRAEVAEAASAIASANWRASAELVARHCADALFIDMGSTTTDLVPIRGGAIVALGETDAGRLAHGELVYAGLVRGRPQAGLTLVPFDGCWTPLVDESFATMADVRRLLGDLPEGADLMPTADGRAKTAEASRARLARLVGRDAADASDEAWRDLAAFLACAQMRLIEDRIALVRSRGALMPDAPIVGAGVGRAILARLALIQERAYRDFAEFIDAPPRLERAVGDCAPAAAVALLRGGPLLES